MALAYEEQKALDAAKPLDIREGVIHYAIYGQDGSLIPMTAADAPSMREFVRWVRKHDRYGERP